MDILVTNIKIDKEFQLTRVRYLHAYRVLPFFKCECTQKSSLNNMETQTVTGTHLNNLLNGIHIMTVTLTRQSQCTSYVFCPNKT